MSCSRREEQKSGRTLDVLTDEEQGLRITVDRHGAELVSLARRAGSGEWVGFLYRDGELGSPASGWANHATVMGYYLHRLKAGRSLYRGKEIVGGTHSFLRHKTWQRVESDAASCSLIYRITPEDFLPTDYPLAVSLDLTYSIGDGSIRTAFEFTNAEPELTAHVGFGLHPGFAATSFETFRLEVPAGRYRRHFSPTNYLSGETEEMEIRAGEMPFDREKLSGSYILEFLDVPERRFRFLDPPSRRVVTIDLADVPFVTLWSDGGPFLCVEPCWGLTDHEQQRPFEEKAGIVTIAPRDKLSASFTMMPEIAG